MLDRMIHFVLGFSCFNFTSNLMVSLWGFQETPNALMPCSPSRLTSFTSGKLCLDVETLVLVMVPGIDLDATSPCFDNSFCTSSEEQCHSFIQNPPVPNYIINISDSLDGVFSWWTGVNQVVDISVSLDNLGGFGCTFAVFLIYFEQKVACHISGRFACHKSLL